MVFMTHVVPWAAGVTTPAAKGFQPEILRFQPHPFIIHGTQPVPFFSALICVCLFGLVSQPHYGVRKLSGGRHRITAEGRGDVVAAAWKL